MHVWLMLKVCTECQYRTVAVKFTVKGNRQNTRFIYEFLKKKKKINILFMNNETERP